MDENSPSIQALNAFIASQNALIARTRQDLVKLKNLRETCATAQTPAAVNIGMLDQDVLPWDELSAKSENPMRSIDWSIFASHDVKGLKDFTAATEKAHARRAQPSLYQTSPLSPLQLLVQGAKKTIIMPVLEALDLSFDPPPLSPIPVDIAASQKAQERAKIMDMKNRQFFGGSSLTIRQSEPHGVYMRLDLEDESGVVDVDMSGEQKPISSAHHPPVPLSISIEAEARSMPACEPLSKPSSGRLVRGTNNRKKKRENSPPNTPSMRKSKVKDGPEPDVAFGIPMENAALEVPASNEVISGPPAALSGKKVKPKPATYKLAWSVEEQHLLEQLLEKFPSGSKNRWLQISKAMNGKRTPRQVASRVQKYFEKLKRFGLEEEGAGSIREQDDDEGE